MSRFAFLTLFIALPLSAADRPNIVFILADDVGCEPLGCYGGSSFQTPNIDRLAAEGLQFQHCYSMPVCHPTRICFLTGRYPQKLENPSWGNFPKNLEPHTVAQVMKKAGYSTAVAGKWQLTLLKKDPHHPQRLGFDESCLFGWHEGARYHDPLLWKNGKIMQDTEGKYGPDLYVDFLIDFMERNQSKPFFAFYSMALCHDVTDDLKAPVRYAPGKDRYLNYGEMVDSMDHCVGRIVAAIDRLKLKEKTLVIFTGDNGTASGSISHAEKLDRANARGKQWKYVRDPVYVMQNGQRIRGGKGSLTDTGTHVPLLVRQPGSIQAGTKTNDLVDFSDFFPTFAEAGGGKLSTELKLNGVSFLPGLYGKDYEPARKWAYAERRGGRFWLRDQRWKLYNDGRFFDVKNDPQEKKALRAGALSAEGKAARERLRKAMASEWAIRLNDE